MGRRPQTLLLTVALVVNAWCSGCAFHGAHTPSRIPERSFAPAARGRSVPPSRAGSIGWGHAAVGVALAGVGLVSRLASKPAPSSAAEPQPWKPLPILLFVLVVCQKCAADALTWFTKNKLQMTYSGGNVTLVSEIMKFPMIALAILAFSSPQKLLPSLRGAVTDTPLQLWWVGFLYAAQNLLYFVCLKYTSPATYQVMSQTKMLFTAAFMWLLLGKRFNRNQLFAISMLVMGSVFAQYSEIEGSWGNSGLAKAIFGGLLAVVSALMSALPNVFYEGQLKSEKSEWVSNFQLAFWVAIWVSIITTTQKYFEGAQLGIPSLTALSSFTPLVWVIVVLKTLNCILVPATFKYADNILYGYAKPVAIVLTLITTSIVESSLPSSYTVAGALLVVSSIVVYGL